MTVIQIAPPPPFLFFKEVKGIAGLVSQIYDFGLYVSKCCGGVEPSYFFIRSRKERLIGPVLVM